MEPGPADPQSNRAGDASTRHRAIGCSTWRKFGLRAPYPGLFSEPDFESTARGFYLPRAWLGVPGAPSIHLRLQSEVGSEFEEGFLHPLTLRFALGPRLLAFGVGWSARLLSLLPTLRGWKK